MRSSSRLLQRLAQLGGAEVVSRAENKGTRPEYLRQLDDSCSAPSTLRLKVGAQVSDGLTAMPLTLWQGECDSDSDFNADVGIGTICGGGGGGDSAGGGVAWRHKI